MRKVRVLIFGITVLLGINALAQAEPLFISNTGEWKVLTLPEDKEVKAFTSGAEMLLTKMSPNDQSSLAQIRVHSRPLIGSVKSSMDFRRAVFGPQASKIAVLNESVFLKEGRWRYVVEYQFDVGTELMSSSILMATVINGRLYLFSHNSFKDVYQENIQSMRKVLRQMVIRPGAERPLPAPQ